MKEEVMAQCGTGHDLDKFGHSRVFGKNREAVTLNSALLGLVWRVLESYELDPKEFIPESLYRPGNAGAASGQIEAGDYYQVVARALKAIDDEAVGIRAASVMHPSHLDIFGHAWLAVPSLGAGFAMTQNCIGMLNSNLRVRQSQDPARVGLIYERDSDSPIASIEADCEIGGLVRLCRLQYGDSFAPLAVCLRRPQPARRQIWDDYFGVAVQFGAPCDAVFVSRCYAEECLSTAHGGMFTRHQESLVQTMAARGDLDIVMQVKMEIQRQLPSGVVALEKIAEVVDTPVRTLHRKLSQEGTTFRQLLREVRIELAQRYIRDPRHNVTDIAFMLGYSDSAAFTRAFRDWFGNAPSAYRAKLIAPAVSSVSL